jgi:FMN phosphatase YigB (HAD superfamily)
MKATFMFGEDRFGPEQDFGDTYRAVGGKSLSPDTVRAVIRGTFAYLNDRYIDPACVDRFPSLSEALAATAPELSDEERAVVELTFALHERGSVPGEYAEVLRALSATHELRLLTNVWARKEPWLEELSRVGVLPRFSHAVFSSDTRSIKPSPRLLTLALNGLRCRRDEILMIGDSWERDILPAHAAGLRTLWITPESSSSLRGPDPDYRLPSLLALLAERTPAA